MITSWNWVLLTDFASFKPTHLAEVSFIIDFDICISSYSICINMFFVLIVFLAENLYKIFNLTLNSLILFFFQSKLFNFPIILNLKCLTRLKIN